MDLIVWVDTAFDGELVVPLHIIHKLALQHSGAVQATLADGSTVVLDSFHLELSWFGSWRQIEVIANEGHLPLLGIGLLRGHKLTVDYGFNELQLE